MLLALLQFDLLIRGSESLKDKRRVVKSLKDRLHAEHMVSVAEIGLLDRHDAARLGLAAVGTDVKHLQSMTDRILDKVRGLHDAELGDFQRDILHGEAVDHDSSDDPAEHDGATATRREEPL
ncbi:MAG: DUF503 domain-containing protein [Phycisphaerales bacterium]